MVRAYQVVVFLSAFILFQLELLSTQRLLPHFGGSFQVWSTALVFYNVLLLLGYAAVDYWGDKLTHRLYPRLHVALCALGGAFFFFDFVADAVGQGAPSILWILSKQIGVPFLLLSMTLPLLQLWSAQTSIARSYNLYFFSGLGSVLGLVSYPLLGVFLPLSVHWNVLAALYALLLVAILLARTSLSPRPGVLFHASSPHQRQWFLGSFVTCFLMLTATNLISQFIGSIPLVWIIPLIIYLVSFLLVFRPWYSERTMLALLALWCAGLVGMLLAEATGYRKIYLGLMFASLYLQLFLCCTVVNRKLYELRPSDSTSHFNFFLNLGGVCATVFVSFGVPLLGRVLQINFLEAGLAFVFLILFLVSAHGNIRERLRRRKKLTFALTALLVLLLVAPSGTKDIAYVRNFYSVIRLIELEGRRVLLNGQIIHGSQFIAADKKAYPLNYYHPRGPFAEVMEQISPRGRVAVIGLGVGSMAYYSRAGEHWTFYEIDEDMERLAREYFSYLQEASAQVRVVIGDGRVRLAQERERFDLIVVDAFSGDAVPSHLMTREAIELYLSKLTSDEGALVFHVSNIFINLPAVLRATADEMGLGFAFAQRSLSDELGESNSFWCVVTKNPLLLRKLQEQRWPATVALPKTAAWSDDRVSFLHPMLLMLR